MLLLFACCFGFIPVIVVVIVLLLLDNLSMFRRKSVGVEHDVCEPEHLRQPRSRFPSLSFNLYTLLPVFRRESVGVEHNVREP